MELLSSNTSFREMDSTEMMKTDGGSWPVVVGIIVVCLIVAATAKRCADADKEDN